jgi:hypothetical protein
VNLIVCKAHTTLSDDENEGFFFSLAALSENPRGEVGHRHLSLDWARISLLVLVQAEQGVFSVGFLFHGEIWLRS